MPAKNYLCKVIESRRLTPTVFELRFEASGKIPYFAGQFLSVVIPGNAENGKKLRRLYSFASAPEVAKQEGYLLCIKQVPNGTGSNYLASLNPGDKFEASAPFGDFYFEPRRGNPVLLISTGTGIAPIRAIAQSRELREAHPELVVNLFGARSETEVLYPGFFHALGIQEVHAISRPMPSWPGFKGRVTDLLLSDRIRMSWRETQVYLCGNGDMISEVNRILIEKLGVPRSFVHLEAYFTPSESGVFVESEPEAVVRLKRVA